LIKVLGGGILILMGLHQLTKILTGSTPGGLVKGGAGAASGAAAGGGAVKAAEGVGEKLAAVAAL
jgi:hypothetical protein